MTSASIQEIKKELQHLDPDTLQALCLRLAKYKKENKELLNYLLFEAHDEPAFVRSVKEELATLFEDLPSSSVYLMKKSIRKVLRFLNRQVKYSSVTRSELELRIFFCTKMKAARVPLATGTVLFNLYAQQIKKIEGALAKLPEDIRADYDRDLSMIIP